MTVREKDKKYIANTYNRFQPVLVSGSGAVVKDEDGKEYIDMGSGIGVNVFGYSDPEWAAAVAKQAAQLQHTSNLYYTEPCVKLAEMLCAATGMDKVFFGNSGAEANECAVKVARKYASDNYGPEKNVILTLCNSFHGRTLTTLSATGQEHYHELFQPLTPGFRHVCAGDIEGLERELKKGDVAALLMECVQGEGGVIPVDPDWALKAEKLLKEYGALLMIDEVQTGNGRTGALYAYMNYVLKPDVVTTAKGLGGGLPIGAALLSSKVSGVLGFGDHGSTFGGNPVACAGACSVIGRIDEKLLSEVRRKGKWLTDFFGSLPGVRSVSGMGLMIGIQTERPAGDIVRECVDKGVLCLTAKDRVRLLPPLTISDGEMKKAAEIIAAAIGAY